MADKVALPITVFPTDKKAFLNVVKTEKDRDSKTTKGDIFHEMLLIYKETKKEKAEVA
ncbi:MAG: hypothetical protein JXN64_04895 [Spirochaetes bacterium]|nr:hypothetical protein [Spirochaetota bacterium]